MSTQHFVNSLGVDNVTTFFLDETDKLPLVISPRFDDSLEFLCKWLVANRRWVEEQMLKYGAVLIRGFAIDDAPEFEQAISSLQPNLCDSYRGTSPRSVFEGTRYTFSAADVPLNYPIGQHVEMAFLKSPPRQLYFGCLQESNSGGGETSLCDFRKVYQELDHDVRKKFEEKKVLYNRTHPKIGAKWTVDVGSMLSWTQLFGTSDMDEVEAISQEEDAAPVNWVGPNNDTFHQEWTDEATQLHPDTKEKVWFNHAQVFHYSTFPAELFHAFTRIGDIRFLLRAIFIGFVAVIKYYLLGHRMALDIRFGDGSPISISEMNEVRKVVHKNMVFSTWEKGDIMCIDNFSTSHGRQPTYDFGRKVLVAWSNPHDKTSTSPSHTSYADATSDQVDRELKKCGSALFNDGCVPGAIEATPNPSPDSTLTSFDAHNLTRPLQCKNDDASSRKLHERHISCPSQSLKNIFQ